MSTILVLQHEECETLGFIEDALREYDLTPRYIRPYAGDSVPGEIGDARGLVVLGGPMGAYEIDAHPYLAGEQRLILDTVRRKTPVLGVCLGAQLMAAALGAHVYAGDQKEVGWFPIDLNTAAADDPLLRGVEQRFMALHWHGDFFDLPEGAVRLASSSLTPNQAFRFGRNAYGVQWRMEMTETMIAAVARVSEEWFRESGIDPNIILGGVAEYLPNLRRIAGIVFKGWAKLTLSVDVDPATAASNPL